MLRVHAAKYPVEGDVLELLEADYSYTTYKSDLLHNVVDTREVSGFRLPS